MVTSPVHPWVGQKLPVARRVRLADGRRYVDLRHPSGRVLRVPADFTDEALPAGLVGAARVSAAGLLRLAAAVAAHEEQELDSCGRARSDGSPEQTSRCQAALDPGASLRGHHARADAGGDGERA